MQKRSRRVRFALAVIAIVTAVCVYKSVSYMSSEYQRDSLNIMLSDAVRKNDTVQVTVLLARGADPNASARHTESPTIWQRLKVIFMHRGLARGPSVLQAAVEPLLCDPNSLQDPLTFRPEQLAIVKTLVEHGANVNYRDDVGNTALNYAVARAGNQAAEVMLDHGADVNNANNTGESPLMEAAADDNATCISTLLRRRANVNQQSKTGYTALFYAAQGPDNTVSILRDLLNHGANARIKDATGRSAIDYAPRTGASQKTELLKQAGAR